MEKRTTRHVLFATQWWQNDLMQGVARHAAEHRWNLDLQMLMSGVLPEDWTGDGIITTLGENQFKGQDFLLQGRCPTVSLSLNQPNVDIPRIGIDNAIAGKLAAEHFLDRGFTSFAFYNGIMSHAGELRFRAFERHITQAGYTVTDLRWTDAEYKRSVAWLKRQKQLCSKLSTLPKPLAVFAHDDSSGTEVIAACQVDSLDIPAQVAVLGMLDIALFRESTTVPLSSISVDFDQNARIACDLLARMMEGEAPPREPILFPPTGIAVRESTDTIAAHTPDVAKAIRFMLAHYPEPIGVPEIARTVGLSHTHFYNAFRADLGQSPGAVLTRIRLDKAKRMLQQTSEKVHVISEACGFGDRINLHRHFKRHLNTSPAAYRRETKS